jgi:tetratricopeptide (TPR) repeat protein
MKKEDKIKFEEKFEELVEKTAEKRVPEVEAFEMNATLLKSAAQLRQEKKERLKERLRNREVIDRLERAVEKILEHNPTSVSNEEWENFKEKTGSIEAWKKSADKLAQDEKEGKDQGWVTLQKVAGIPIEIMLEIYGMARTLSEEGSNEEALDIAVFLTTYAPDVIDFWEAQGIILKELGKIEESQRCFDFAESIG